VKAALHETFGGVEVLEIRKVPDPSPGPRDVLISVRAAAMNRLDVLQRRGPPLLPAFSLPHIAGMDIAGEVIEIGSAVDSVAVGDRVVVNPALHCGRCDQCLSGDDGFCPHARVIGGNCPGGHAELCVVPAANVYVIPEPFGYTEAATIPTVYSTAWHALLTAGDLGEGETVMIHAAGSGVSTGAIQLARSLGAKVLATAGSQRKLDVAERLGAQILINNREQDVAAAAHEATGGEGVDMVFDHVGPDLFEASLLALRPRGRLVTSGTTTGVNASFSLPDLYQFGKRIIGAGRYSSREFEAMLDFYWKKGFEPVIDSEFPLEDIREAHGRMETNEVIGKIITYPVFDRA
jgi:NADPH:quinone reductase-like Zn-dependent oxidoreductase